MESLNKAVNKDSILVAYLRGGVGSLMKSPGGDRFSRNYQRRSSGSTRSPLSPLENMKTPMVEEDEVLLMDGVLVSPLVGSGSSSNSSSSSSGKSVYKKELRRAWEDLGHCSYASNRQFAHGKDEFHPSGFSIKNKELVQTCKSHATSPRSSPCVPKCRILPPAMTNAAVAAKQTAFSTIPEYTSIGPTIITSEKSSKNSTTPISTPDEFGRTYISIRPDHSNKIPTASIKSEDSRMDINTTVCSDYWSPQDDGIDIALPHQTNKRISREEVNACGPATKKRLPVFSEFCPG
ncbi:hypothetical protein BDE02_02G077400 [Populus trichocarpa]|nr:hypothetical protein BDE02_02G077400 [Populus trichocarpa]